MNNSQSEHLEKRGFPSHMTIYRYKYRHIWTEIQTWRTFSLRLLPKGLRLSHWPEYVRAMIRREKLA